MFPCQSYKVGFIISPISGEETEGSNTAEEGSAFWFNPQT